MAFGNRFGNEVIEVIFLDLNIHYKVILLSFCVAKDMSLKKWILS